MNGALGRAARWVVVLAVFTACGGGGGGGGSGLQVTPGALTFTAVQNGPLPPPQSLHVHQNPDLTYGSTIVDGSGPAWLQETSFAMIDHSKPEFDHTFAVTTTDLAPGTYTATFEITITEPAPYSGTGPYIPGPTVEEKSVSMTYVVTAP